MRIECKEQFARRVNMLHVVPFLHVMDAVRFVVAASSTTAATATAAICVISIVIAIAVSINVIGFHLQHNTS
jgi:uncharacterized membrane protein